MFSLKSPPRQRWISIRICRRWGHVTWRHVWPIDGYFLAQKMRIRWSSNSKKWTPSSFEFRRKWSFRKKMNIFNQWKSKKCPNKTACLVLRWKPSGWLKKPIDWEVADSNPASANSLSWVYFRLILRHKKIMAWSDSGKITSFYLVDSLSSIDFSKSFW